jgi:hypothetical protein
MWKNQVLASPYLRSHGFGKSFCSIDIVFGLHVLTCGKIVHMGLCVFRAHSTLVGASP